MQRVWTLKFSDKGLESAKRLKFLGAFANKVGVTLKISSGGNQMGGFGATIKRAASYALAPVTMGASLTPGGSGAINTSYDMTDKALHGELGSAGAAPAAEDAPPVPDPGSGAVDDAARKERRAKGRSSTYFTGARGLTSSATTASRTLLGS